MFGLPGKIKLLMRWNVQLIIVKITSLSAKFHNKGKNHQIVYPQTNISNNLVPYEENQSRQSIVNVQHVYT